MQPNGYKGKLYSFLGNLAAEEKFALVQDLMKRKGVGILMRREIAGNVEEFFGINDRVAVIVIKLNKL